MLYSVCIYGTFTGHSVAHYINASNNKIMGWVMLKKGKIISKKLIETLLLRVYGIGE